MSYGTNAPTGFRPVRHLNGSTWNGQTESMNFVTAYGTSVFRGDPVTLLNTGYIGRGVAGQNAIVGIFWGCRYKDVTGFVVNSLYWPASTATLNSEDVEVLVVAQTDVVYDIQTSNLVGGLVRTNINNNATFALGTGSTFNGMSGATLDGGTLAATADLNLKVIGLSPDPLNSFGVQYNNALVIINNHSWGSSTGTAGV